MLPFPAKSFDGVSCLEVIEHVDNKKSAVKEITRVLKENGKVVISTPNPRMINMAKGLGWKDVVHESKDYFIEEQDLVRLFKMNGFELKSFKHFFWFPSGLRFLFPLSNLLGETFRPGCYNYVLVLQKTGLNK